MPEAKVLPFRVIQGGKIPAPDLEPAPEATTNDEVMEVLALATDAAKDNWTEVLVLYRDEDGEIDSCYSTMTDQERLYFMEWAKKILLHE
jgi:hypothetical protein